MKKSSIKVAAVATILALGVGLTHDALAGGRIKSGHFADGKRSASEFDDRGRRVFIDRKGRRITKPATVCPCTELGCCDYDFSDTMD
jgi:hypothetical protein